MQLVVILLLVTGMVFVYAAVKGEDPRELIKRALRKGK